MDRDGICHLRCLAVGINGRVNLSSSQVPNRSRCLEGLQWVDVVSKPSVPACVFEIQIVTSMWSFYELLTCTVLGSVALVQYP